MPPKPKRRCFKFNPKRFTKYSIGALFFNVNKMAPEHPDAMGELDIPKVLLDDLGEQFSKTGKAKISLASWNNTSKDVESYQTLTRKLPTHIVQPYSKKESL